MYHGLRKVAEAPSANSARWPGWILIWISPLVCCAQNLQPVPDHAERSHEPASHTDFVLEPLSSTFNPASLTLDPQPESSIFRTTPPEELRHAPASGIIPAAHRSYSGVDLRPASPGDDRYGSGYDAGYHRGLLFQLTEGDDTFSLKINLRTQFRLSTFAADAVEWTDNAGVTRPIDDRRNFDLERARLILSGHAFTKELKYFLQLDGDHDGGHFVDFFDYWWAWHFSDRFELQFGKRKVAAARNWMLGAFDTRLADRPFSTDFFRPGRSVGVWVVGDPHENLHYEFAATDGYRTDNLRPPDTNNEFAFSGTSWWDVVGSYGSASPVDFEYHCDPAVRLGWSWATAVKGSAGSTLNETDFVRLSDGTRLTQFQALGPGATVEEFDLTFAGVDAAFKHRGWSANAEFLFRWIGNILADMPISQTELFQYGYYVEGGVFLIPQTLEINTHVAGVKGDFGDTTGFAAGFSWYPRQTRNLKLTIDATKIDGSPANSTGSDILVGDDGVLTRIQFQALF